MFAAVAVLSAAKLLQISVSPFDPSTARTSPP